MSSSKVPLRLTFGLMLCCFSAVSAARVILSLYALQLEARPFTVGLLIGTFFVFPILLSWPIGIASDRLGSRWPLLAGTLICVAGVVVPFFVRSLPALFVAAGAISLAFTNYAVLLQNLVGLLSTPSERTRNFSNSSVVTGSTLFLGPLLGGFALDHLGAPAACLTVAALTLCATAMLVTWGHTLPKGAPRPAGGGGLRQALAHPAVLRVIVAGTVVQFGQDLFQFYLPVYAHAVNLSASAIGVVLATASVGFLVIRIFLPRLIAWRSEETLLRYAFWIAAASFVVVPFLESAWLLAAVAFVFGLGMGAGQPITTVLLFSRSDPARSGEMFGLRQTTNNVVRAGAPTACGLIASGFGLTAVFLIAAVIVGLGGALVRGRLGGPDTVRGAD